MTRSRPIAPPRIRATRQGVPGQPADAGLRPGPTFGQVADLARALLATNVDPVVRYRILRDVLDAQVSPRLVAEAAREAERSPWVRRLIEAQRADGSWGRFHTENTREAGWPPTTEYAVERALALGLDRRHPVMRKAADYMAEVLAGRRAWPDPPERNDRWATGVQLITAATLALVDSDHPALDRVWGLWLEIVQRAFRSGTYDSQAEASAHRELTGASVQRSYLTLDNRYTITLLGRESRALPHALRKALLGWLCDKADGIGYLQVPLRNLPPGLTSNVLDRWLRSWEVLSGIAGWHEYAGQAMVQLWAAQGGVRGLGLRPPAPPVSVLSFVRGLA